MEKDLTNKVAVITGAATGIGYAIAENFIQKGAIIILLDINTTEGDQAVKKLNSKYNNKASFIKCDITKDLNDTFDNIFSKYDYVDILVNNAGITDEFSIRRTIETNTIATIECSMKFYGKMRVDKGVKGGTIINIASVYGFMIDPFMVYYKASKFAVIGFSNFLGHAYNYGLSRVRVLVICPGVTSTNVAANVEIWPEHNAESKKWFSERRIQSPDDVGKAAVEIFETAVSGKSFVIAAGEPLREVESIYIISMVSSFKLVFRLQRF